MIIKDLIEKYNEKYGISYIDLADAGESNRIIVHIASACLFGFALFCIGLYSIKFYSELSKHINSFIYYIVMLITSSYAFFASKQKKEQERKKSYLNKTISFYVLMYILFANAVFTVIVGAYFNGFIVFCMTAVIAVCTCSFSPMLFLLGMVITIGVMTPYLYKAFGAGGYANSLIMVGLLFFLSLYKRRVEKKHLLFLKKQKQNLEAKTFGNFTLIYENKVVKFSRTKSDELMGYLIYKKGSSVKTKELISVLWGERADSARYGSSFRNLIVDIKHTLNELEIQNFFIAEYNNFRINPEVIKCDYYDFLDGQPSAIKSFAGEFMSQFSWAEEAVGFLEQKALKKN
ncbi:hypothetical protein [Treponema bryantii]|uniref:hypothetical protein n=1 Tax=Treponema bryantii TaxID=163 RepID=UPI002B29A575|nr:hypothetical protein TRBR_28480 [Treponema bryantii]